MKALRLVGFVTVLLGTLMVSSCKNDPCKNVTCQNGGTCQDGNCRCSLPWEGSKCEVDARDKFVASWRGPITCGGGVEEITFPIRKSGAVPTRIIVDDDFYGELTSSNAFTIPSQTADLDGTPVTVSGSGTLNGSQLSMTLVYVVSGTSITCTVTADKL